MPAARLGVLSLLCHRAGTIAGGGDGTITLFNESGRDLAQTRLEGGVVAMSFSPDKEEASGAVAGTARDPVRGVLHLGRVSMA